VAARQRLPRSLHPVAWWCWALGLATAASRTTNPLLLALITAVAGFVVARRRSDAPWARGFRIYLFGGLAVVAIRVLFRMLFDAQQGAHVLFVVPEVPLPDAAAALRIGGPVSLEGVLAAAYDGLRLATLLLCVGAANVLANPKRLLRSLPAALYELGAALTVAITLAPQVIESAWRVSRARQLRGSTSRRRLVREVAFPVLEDALDRSLSLAAAMDARGYGRRAAVTGSRQRTTAALVLGGLVGICVGTYGLLDGTTPRALGAPAMALGLVLAAGGMALAGRQVRRTSYRPDPWAGPEWAVSACGALAAGALILFARIDPGPLNPSLQPLTWPTLPLLPALGLLAGLGPAWLAPPVVQAAPPAVLRPPAPAVQVGAA
jgi:energy-coupling factor transport system permease protein